MPIENGPPQEPLHDILLFVRAGIHILMHRKRARPHVIRDPPQPPPIIGLVLILLPTHFRRRPHDRQNAVDMVIRRHALQCRRASLEPHPRIDILRRQRPQVIRRLTHAIELREHQVPNLDRL